MSRMNWERPYRVVAIGKSIRAVTRKYFEEGSNDFSGITVYAILQNGLIHIFDPHQDMDELHDYVIEDDRIAGLAPELNLKGYLADHFRAALEDEENRAHPLACKIAGDILKKVWPE